MVKPTNTMNFGWKMCLTYEKSYKVTTMEKSVVNLSKNEKTISKDLWACFLGFF
jgi:hypothetical protein